MPTPTSGSSELFFNIEGVGFWSQTIPYDVTVIDAPDVTAMVAAAMADVGKWFVLEYMPLRFHPAYARQQLGYKILPSTYKQKERRARTLNADAINPNTWTGETRKAAMAAWPTTSAVNGTRSMKVNMKLRMRLPQHANNSSTNTITRETLSKITPMEGERMARRFFKLVADAASRVQTTVVATRTGKLVPRHAVSPQDAGMFGRSSRLTLTAARSAAKERSERDPA